jgi:hypothetical protein
MYFEIIDRHSEWSVNQSILQHIRLELVSFIDFKQYKHCSEKFPANAHEWLLMKHERKFDSLFLSTDVLITSLRKIF